MTDAGREVDTVYRVQSVPVYDYDIDIALSIPYISAPLT